MNAKLDQGNRTFIGSVCFVDIVGYSKKSVSEQITMKDRFTALLSESLKDVAIDQRIILDTGDGAAISFLGDPEDALFVSMNMRDFLQRALVNASEAAIASELGLRIGINLGPVKLVRDINGQPNIVGDGINVAQRIMSFAQPAQIVVSRSYYDVVSVISDEYAKLFQYEGSRTDKHVREHEIYIVGESAAAFDQAKAGMVDRAATTNTKIKLSEAGMSVSTGAHSHPGFHDGALVGGGLSAFLQDRKKLTLVGASMGIVAIALITALAMKNPTGKTIDNANKIADAVQPASTGPIPVVKSDKTEPTKTGATAATTPSSFDGTAVAADATKSVEAGSPAAVGLPTSPLVIPSSLPPISAAAGAASTVAAKAGEDRKSLKADQSKTDVPKPATGMVTFSIQPWGEVFVNGKSIGVSPPLKHTRLAPGKYKIEIKNSTFTPLSTSIEVKSKEESPIKHRFQ